MKPTTREKAPMREASIIGIDLAKRVFQVHGAAADGSVVFRKKLSRGQLVPFLAAQPRCTVAMEACATAHDWGRAIADLGHDVRLIPPVYVKPFVKRQKNDAADAEAIVEAASRPTMRFVAVKTEAQQARAMIFRTRDLLVRQRTQLINALRGHLAEHGVVVPKGTSHLGQLSAAIEDEARLLPSTVREIGGSISSRSAPTPPRSSNWGRRCAPRPSRARRRRACRPCLGSGQSRRWRLRRSRRRWRRSNADAILPRGWVSYRFSDRLAVSSGWARLRRWASGTFGAS